MDHDRFVIKEILGKGFFGITYLAHDKHIHKDVALKVVTLRDDVEFLNAIDEIETLKYLSREYNKNIVLYYDSFIEVREGEKILFLISEYINGTSLSTYIRMMVNVTPKILLSIIYGLVSGLLYIHDNKYAHGDIKPDNIMIDNDGNVKYIDFGLSCIDKCRYIGCANSCSSRKLMSLVYASPDYYRENSRDITLAQSNDIWSLGVVLFQLANMGKLPFNYSKNPDILKSNILLAPKYRSSYIISDINDYIHSFLINNHSYRPDIKLQYTLLTNIIRNDINNITNQDSTPDTTVIIDGYS